MDDYDSYKRYTNTKCPCGCPSHCGHSCLDCDNCTDCECKTCKEQNGLFN